MIESRPASGRAAPRALVIGRATDEQFASLNDRLRSRLGQDCVETCESIDLLLSDDGASRTADHAELLLVLQSWPEQYAQTQVWDLLDRFPLARLIVCYGPWCDSDGRTRDLWPPAARVPLARTESRLLQELAVLRGASDTLPLTANRDETYGRDFAEPLDEPLIDLSVEVRTPDPAIRNWLAELFGSVGVSLHADCRHSPAEPHANVLVWDVDPWSAVIADQIADTRRQRPVLTIIGLAGFARLHEIARMRQCGVDAVVAKTCSGAEILRVIESLPESAAARSITPSTPKASMVPS